MDGGVPADRFLGAEKACLLREGWLLRDEERSDETTAVHVSVNTMVVSAEQLA